VPAAQRVADRRTSPAAAAVIAVIAVVGVALIGLTVAFVGSRLGSRSAGPPGSGVVIEVVDGDTIDVAIGGREERVRLLGIDTPETVDPDRAPECFGSQASARTAELLPTGTEIRIERDVEGRDRYGRLLAYVFRRADGLLVNRALVEEGMAEPLDIAPNHAYRPELAAAAARARAAGRGLWAACARDPPRGALAGLR
jgi:micrococcal nuclease